jgi:hypothetical protein
LLAAQLSTLALISIAGASFNKVRHEIFFLRRGGMLKITKKNGF